MGQIQYNSTVNTPLIRLLKRANLQITDICRLLEISQPTYRNWIKNPQHITVKHLISLSALFHIRPEVLLYLLIRNKPNLTKDIQKNWFDSGIETDINKEKGLI